VLVAERLSLIQGHLSKMPVCVIGGLTIVNGFLLVALKIEGHEFGLDGKVWTIDGKDITQLTEQALAEVKEEAK